LLVAGDRGGQSLLWIPKPHQIEGCQPHGHTVAPDLDMIGELRSLDALGSVLRAQPERKNPFDDQS
jgi:hypothetical protein